jgi:hypothetical protein
VRESKNTRNRDNKLNETYKAKRTPAEKKREYKVHDRQTTTENKTHSTKKLKKSTHVLHDGHAGSDGIGDPDARVGMEFPGTDGHHHAFGGPLLGLIGQQNSTGRGRERVLDPNQHAVVEDLDGSANRFPVQRNHCRRRC